MSKRTDWFPTSVNPVHVGFYEVTRPSMFGTSFYKCRMLWNGANWRYRTGYYSDFGKPWEIGNKWRGLAEPSK